MTQGADGARHALEYPLAEAIYRRRSRRISKGVREVPAGTLSYTSTQTPQPLSPLEEAMLIAATGATGLTMPDRPFETDTGVKILGSPNINMVGRSAGSPDNCQATNFFLINDSGTYFLKHLDVQPAEFPPDPGTLLARAEQCKQKVLDARLDFPREFPYYFDSNRFLSNLPGSTMLLPVVDTTRQYINGLMYLLTQPDGCRPTFVDDRNFYRAAGVRKWTKNGFLNKDIKIPLSVCGTFRSDVEAALILQNLMLTLQAMGLGGWIHASAGPQYILGHPMFTQHGKGLGFHYETPGFRLLDLIRWGTFLPKVRANPVGLDGVLEGLCPPYHATMNDAVDELLKLKYGPDGRYSDLSYFQRIFKGDLGSQYIAEVPHYVQDSIDCAKDVCTYIHKTHGRFPAHCDAIQVPGIWIQAHHLDLNYYDALFTHGYTETHRLHAQRWH